MDTFLFILAVIGLCIVTGAIIAGTAELIVAVTFRYFKWRELRHHNRVMAKLVKEQSR